jgi:hypothetical protein
MENDDGKKAVEDMNIPEEDTIKKRVRMAAFTPNLPFTAL